MAKVTTTLFRDGIWNSPEGPVEITPERRQHFANQFKKMKEAQLSIPVSWAHTKEALPNKDDKNWAKSRYNAGYLDHVENDATSTKIVLDVPGVTVEGGKLLSIAELPGTKTPVRTAIKEVSAGIAKKFLDGQAREWDDVLTHVALTPHPVVDAQTGFQGLGLVEGMQMLSLDATWLAVDDEKKEKKEGKEEPKKEEVKEERKEEETAKQDTETPAVVEETESPNKGEETPAPPAEEEMGAKYSFEALLSDLHGMGIALPPDTKPDETGWERLWVAVHALKNAQGGAGAGGGPVQEERPDHLMMSLERDNPAAFKAMKKLEEENRKLQSAERKRRWDKARDRHDALCLPKVVTDKHFLALGQSNLSLDSLSEKTLCEYETQLSLAESIWSKDMAMLTQQLGLSTETENPITRQQKAAEDTSHVDDMIATATGKRPDPGLPNRNGKLK